MAKPSKLLIQRSNGSMLREFRISELRTLLDSVAPSILRKNLVSDACTCDHTLLVIRFMTISENGDKNCFDD